VDTKTAKNANDVQALIAIIAESGPAKVYARAVENGMDPVNKSRLLSAYAAHLAAMATDAYKNLGEGQYVLDMKATSASVVIRGMRDCYHLRNLVYHWAERAGVSLDTVPRLAFSIYFESTIAPFRVTTSSILIQSEVSIDDNAGDETIMDVGKQIDTLRKAIREHQTITWRARRIAGVNEYVDRLIVLQLIEVHITNQDMRDRLEAIMNTVNPDADTLMRQQGLMNATLFTICGSSCQSWWFLKNWGLDPATTQPYSIGQSGMKLLATWWDPRLG
jgi:hypothetical protein